MDSKGNTEQKEKTGGIIIPDFKLSYRAKAIKTVLAQKQTRRLVEQKTQI
jgi:hypothetical protein